MTVSEGYVTLVQDVDTEKTVVHVGVQNINGSLFCVAKWRGFVLETK